MTVGHDDTGAARIDEDRGQRGGHAGDAWTGAAVDAFARECRKHMVAVRVFAGGAAEGAGERRPSAEARDCDRGIGSAAAVDHEVALRGRLGVRLRKALDPEYLVEHDDPGA